MFDHVPSTDHSLLQDPAFAAALRSLGQSPLQLPNGQMLLSRRILGVPVLMLPRATPPPDLQAQLKHLNLQRHPIILSPEDPCAVRRSVRLRKPQTRALLDLSPDRDRRRAALHGKWRNALKRAERATLKIRRTPLPPDPNHPLLLAEVTDARKRGYGNWPPALTAAYANVAPEKTILFTAHKGRTELAHCLFLRYGTQACYHIGHTTDAGRLYGAHNLLIWSASNWLADQGCHTLDLGLIDQTNPGLTRFKVRTGAILRPTGGTWLHWSPLARSFGT